MLPLVPCFTADVHKNAALSGMDVPFGPQQLIWLNNTWPKSLKATATCRFVTPLKSINVPATELAAMGVHKKGYSPPVPTTCPKEFRPYPVAAFATRVTFQFPGAAFVTGSKLAVIVCE